MLKYNNIFVCLSISPANSDRRAATVRRQPSGSPMTCEPLHYRQLHITC